MPLSLRLLSSAICVVTLVGCATAPPTTYDVVNSRVYPWGKEEVFGRLVDVAARNAMFVTASDRRYGVHNVERSIVSPSRSGAVYNWADCGLVSLTERPTTQFVELSMVVEPAKAGSRVTINSRFSEVRQDLTNRTRRLNCTSTGVLERELLESMAH